MRIIDTSQTLLRGVGMVIIWCLLGCQSPREGAYKAHIGFSVASDKTSEALPSWTSLGDTGECRDYDTSLITAIEERWYDLLLSVAPYEKPGTVVISFELYSDGKISDLRVTETSVEKVLTGMCLKAIWDLEPYPKWPEQMRQLVGKDSRKITFTFNYRDWKRSTQ